MTFMHKLSARLARIWSFGLAFLLPPLSQIVDPRHLVEGSCLALLMALWRKRRRALAIKGLSLESGDHRRCRHITLPNGRRMRDRHPCRDVRVPGTRWRIRVALLIVRKIP